MPQGWRTLLASGEPVVLAGDYNVMPTDLDVYAPERWVDDALFRPEVREAHRLLVAQGRTDALRQLHRASAFIRSGNIFVRAPVWIELAGAKAAAGNSRGRRPVSSHRVRAA